MASARDERFVWQQWRRVWYMGRVVARDDGRDGAASVNVHVHGEPDTSDKWLSAHSPRLVPVAVVPSELAAVGAFPALHACVELLQMDAALYALLQSGGGSVPLLVGRVVQVLPARDASVVDVLYPPAYHHVVRERRVHIGNGYLHVISERELLERLPLGSPPLDSRSTQ